MQLQSSSRGTGEAEGGTTPSPSGDPQDYSFAIVATIAPQGVPAQ